MWNLPCIVWSCGYSPLQRVSWSALVWCTKSAAKGAVENMYQSHYFSQSLLLIEVSRNNTSRLHFASSVKPNKLERKLNDCSRLRNDRRATKLGWGLEYAYNWLRAIFPTLLLSLLLGLSFIPDNKTLRSNTEGSAVSLHWKIQRRGNMFHINIKVVIMECNFKAAQNTVTLKQLQEVWKRWEMKRSFKTMPYLHICRGS